MGGINAFLKHRLGKVGFILLAGLLLHLPSLQALVFQQVNPSGFGDPANNQMGMRIEVFSNCLYSATGGGVSSAELWRTRNGTLWTQANTDGFGNFNNSYIFSLAVYSNSLYAGTFNLFSGGEIWRSRNGTSWTQVIAAGFGRTTNIAIMDLAVFNGWFYASTYALDWMGGSPAGGDLFRTKNGLTWQAVTNVNHGFHNASRNVIIEMIVFGGNLYAAVNHDITGPEIWRTANGTNWQLIPGTVGGFGDVNNTWMNLGTEGAYLYSATANLNGSQVWRSSDGLGWTLMSSGGFGDAANESPGGLVQYSGSLFGLFGNTVTGVEVWKTVNHGTNWVQENLDGFGDVNNSSSGGVAVFNSSLYAHVGNGVAGVEVWRGWTPPCALSVMKNANAPTRTVIPPSTNLLALAFSATDTAGHLITSIGVSRIGSMQNATEISNLKLWRDLNSSGTRDPGDVLIAGSAVWNAGSQTWNFNGLSVPSGWDLLVTVSLAAGAGNFTTFKGLLMPGSIVCATNNTSLASLTNSNFITVSNGVVLALPYFNDFESGNGGYSELGSSHFLWEYGIPSVVGPPSAHSATHCWGTVIAGYYGQDYIDDYLVLPPADLRNVSSATMSFWQYYDTEGCCDGGTVEISTNGGSVYLPLSGMFAGASPGWIRQTLDLTPYCRTAAIIRFHFYSDFSVNTYPGWYIDDVSMTAPDQLSVTRLTNTPGGTVNPGTNNVNALSFRVSDGAGHILTNLAVRNLGTAVTTDISNLSLWYDVNGNRTRDGSDLFCSAAVWNAGRSAWEFRPLSVVHLATNFILTAGFREGAVAGRTIRLAIQTNGATCSGAGRNSTGITNAFSLVAGGDGVTVTRLFNAPGGGVLRGQTNVTAAVFEAVDFSGHAIDRIRLRHSGTMVGTSDLFAVRLWYDVNGNNAWNAGDVFVAAGVWNAGISAWEFTGLSVTSGTNLVATVSISTGAVLGRTFRAYVGAGDVRCAAGRTNQSSITNANTLTVNATAYPFFFDDFSTDKFWVYGGDWARGSAASSSCSGMGSQDPASDYSVGADNQILGTVLGGCITAVNHGFYYAETPSLDFSGMPLSVPVVFSFYRWLVSDYPPGYVDNRIEVYNGSAWNVVWTQPGGTFMIDSAWTFQSFDVSAYAAGNPDFRIRFGFSVISAGGMMSSAGWNIDDVRVEPAADRLTINKPADAPARTVFAGTNLQTVLVLEPIDTWNHAIASIKISNAGSMLNNTDVTNLRLWYDVNHDNQYGPADIQAGSAAWWNPSSSTWDFTGLSVPSSTNLVVTVDISATGRAGRTFRAAINRADLLCSMNATNTNRILNANAITIGERILVSLATNYPSASLTFGSNNAAVLAFRMSDSGGHPFTLIRIRNLGTATNVLDIAAARLWYDVNGNRRWDAGDALAVSGTWSAASNRWSFTNFSVRPGTNLLFTADISASARNGRTIRPWIRSGNVFCSSNGWNLNAATNSGTFTILGHVLSVVKLTNVPGGLVDPATNSYFRALALRVQESAGHGLTNLAVRNIGTCQTTDMSNVLLWFDVNGNRTRDGSDVLCSTAVWNAGRSAWMFGGLGVTHLATNFILTVGFSRGAVIGRTFRAAVQSNGAVCSSGIRNASGITNANFLTVTGDQVTVNRIVNIPAGTALLGQTNISAMVFEAVDGLGHSLTAIRIKNLGTAVSGSDIASVKLWYDVNGNNAWNAGDVQAGGPGVWNAGRAAWEFTGLSVASATNLVVTINVSAAAVVGNTFRGFIASGGAACSTGKTNLNTVTNGGSLTIMGFTAVPYSENFETGSGSIWSEAGSTHFLWEWGKPVSVGPATAHSGTNCWGTDINGNYGFDNVSDYLFNQSPFDLRNVTVATLSFWQWYNTEGCCDYGRVQISTNGAVYTTISGLYAGTSGTWVQSKFGLSAYAGKCIYVRFWFTTDSTVNTYPGWYLDEVSISVPDPLSVAKLTNTPGGMVNPGTNNINALSFRIADGPGHSLTNLAVRNIGTCLTTDISNLSLWYDVNGNRTRDGSDILCSTAAWNAGRSAWEFRPLSVSHLGTNFIVTAGFRAGAVAGRTVRLSIQSNGAICSGGGRNFSGITNANTLTVTGDLLTVNRLANTVGGLVSAGATNVGVLVFEVLDNQGHNLTTIRIRNWGTAVNGTDISAVKLWYDVNGNNAWNAGDQPVATGVWNAGRSAWEFTGLSVVPGTNMVVTINLPAGATSGNTVRAFLPVAGAVCSSGRTNLSGVTNANTLTIVNTYALPFRDNGEAYRPAGWTTVLYAGTTDNLWHRSILSSVSSPTSWWCGRYGFANYNTGLRVDTALVSPSILLPSAPGAVTFSFRENYNTESGYDYCYVGITSNAGATWTELRAALSGNSAGWIPQSYDISAWKGKIVMVRFWFDTTDAIGNANPGWFIDDILIDISDALSVTMLTNLPGGNVNPGTNNINVLSCRVSDTSGHSLTNLAVRNIGTCLTTDISNLSLWFDVNGNRTRDGSDILCSTAAWNAGRSAWVFRPLSVTHLATNFIVTAGFREAAVPGRTVRLAIQSNGAICSGGGRNFSGITNANTLTVSWPLMITLPYFNDFESGSGGYSETGSSHGLWEYGVPSFVGPAAAYSGTHCWGTVIAGYYGQDYVDDYLVLPPVDLRNITAATMWFWQYYDTEGCCDGGTVEISTNGGISYSALSSWFGGVSFTWIKEFLDLSPYCGKISSIRFHFQSDYSVNTYPGWYIDDISINIFHFLSVSKTADMPGGSVSAGSNTIPLLSVLMYDSLPDNVTNIAIGNIGTMQNATDVSNMRLWYDRNWSFQYDAGDVACGSPAVWNAGRSAWEFRSLSIPLPRGFTNLIVTFDAASTAVGGRTFRAVLGAGGARCQGGYASFPAVTNLNTVSIAGDLVTVNKLINEPAGFAAAGQTNSAVLAFEAVDGFGHTVNRLRIRNLGTMINASDISAVKLWCDVNGNNLWNTGDLLVAAGVWNAGLSAWEFTSLSVASGTNLIATVNVSAGATANRTFRAMIAKGDARCSSGKTNLNAVTNANTLTVFGGLAIPFFDNFDTGGIDPLKWETAAGPAWTSVNGTGEPSGSYGLNLHESPGSVTSWNLPVSGLSNIIVSWYYQQGPEEPDFGEDLVFQYFDPSLGIWQAMATYPGSGAGPAVYTKDRAILPSAVLRPGFKVRILNTAGSGAGFDDWYVDDFLVADAVLLTRRSNIAAAVVQRNATNQTAQSFRVQDQLGHGVTNLIVTNLGTMQYGQDLSGLKLWYDRNGDGRKDASDIQVTGGIWQPASSTWMFRGFSVPHTPTNLIVTANIASNAAVGRSLRTAVLSGDLLCSGRGYNVAGVTNGFSLRVDDTPPAAVSNLSITTNPSGGMLRLSWRNPSNSDLAGVKIIRRIDFPPIGVNDPLAVTVFSNMSTNFANTGLTNGVLYYYGVYPYDLNRNFGPAAIRCGTPEDGMPPNEVSPLTIAPLPYGNALRLTWGCPTNGDFEGVKVLRKQGSFPTNDHDALATTVWSNFGLGLDDPGLVDGQMYYYRIFTYDDGGHFSPGILASAIPADSIAPDPATGAAISIVSQGRSLRLSWGNPTNTDLSGIWLVRKENSPPGGRNDGYIINLGPSVTTWSDSGLVNGTVYFYRLYCRDEVSNWNSGTTVSGVPVDTVPPGDVTGLTLATNAAGSRLDLAWTNPADPDFSGVRILRKTGAPPTGVNDPLAVAIYSNSGNFFHDVSLVDGILYYYAVFAFDTSRNFSSGVARSGSPRDSQPPSPVISFVATAPPAGGRLTLSWINPPDSDFTGVRIVRNSSHDPVSTNDGVIVRSGTMTSFTDTAVTNGQTVYYTIFAYDDAQNQSAGVSRNAVPADLLPPGPVAGLTVTPLVAGNALGVTWSNPPDPDLGLVKVVAKFGSAPADLADGVTVYSNLGTGFTNPGLTDGVRRYYRVFTFDTLMNHDTGTVGSGIPWDTLPPGAVGGLTVSTQDSALALSWSNPSDPDLAGLRLVRKTGGYPAGINDGTVVLLPVSALSYTDLSLVNGTAYYYTLFTHDEVPNYCGISVSNRAAGTPRDLTPPLVLSVSYNTANSNLIIAFNEVVDVSSIVLPSILLASNASGSFALSASAVLTGVDDSIVRIRLSGADSLRMQSWSSASAAVTFSLLAAAFSDPGNNPTVPASGIPVVLSTDSVPPGPVTGLSVAALPQGGALRLSWTNSTDPDLAGIRVVRKSGSFPSGINDGTIVDLGPAVTAWTDRGLVNGSTWYYAVFSRDGIPNYSGGVMAAGSPQDLQAPADISGLSMTVNPDGNRLDFSWTNPADPDFNGVKVVRRAGTAPSGVNDPAAVTVYSNGGSSFIDSGLVDGTTYYYGFYTFDSSFNFASGTAANGVPADTLAPGAVSGFAVTAAAAGGILDLTWTNPPDADLAFVKIVRKKGSPPVSTNDGVAVYSGTGSSLTDTTVTNGSTWYYSVWTSDEAGNISAAVSGSGTPADTQAPGNVAGLTLSANASGNRIDLSWTAPADSDFAGVRVMRKTSGSPSGTNDGVLVYSGTGTNFSDFGLVDGNRYYYTVFSLDEVPNVSSGARGDVVCGDNQPPGAVTAFSISLLTQQNRSILSWSNPPDSDLTGLRIVRKTAGWPAGPSDGLVVNLGSAATSFTDTGLGAGTRYYYAVFAFDEVPQWSSGTTNSAFFGDFTPPGDVTLLSWTTNRDNEAELSWSNPVDADLSGIRIVRKTGSAPSGVSDGTIFSLGLVTVFTDRGLFWGTNYFYRIFTVDASMNFGSGAVLSNVRVRDHTPPSGVTSLSASVAGLCGAVSLAWALPTNSDLAGIRIVRKSGADPLGPNDGFVTNLGPRTSRTDAGLATGPIFHFAVYAFDRTGNFSLASYATQRAAGIPAACVTFRDPGGLTNRGYNTRFSSATNVPAVLTGPAADRYLVFVTNRSTGTSIRCSSSSLGAVSLADEGTNRVVIVFSNINGLTRAVTNSVILDTQAPAGVTSIDLAGGGNSSDTRRVDLAIDWTGISSDCAGYFLGESSTPPPASSGAWTVTTNRPLSLTYRLSEGAGAKTVNLWVIDFAGNISLARQDSIDYSGLEDIPSGSFIVSPNPLDKQKDSAMIIQYNAPAGASVQFEVFTIMGTLVAVIKDGNSDRECLWSAENDAEQPVASGMYLMIMRVDGRIAGSKPLKIGVINR